MLLHEQGQSLTVQAPAKLNLFLEVLAKRFDGYHELETLLVTVGLYDTLSLTEEGSGRIRLRCLRAGRRSPGESGEPVPEDDRNLVVRAAELLRDHAGVERGVRIALRKRIPAAAGLAGGSSDAAATLVALNRFWKLGLPRDELGRLAARLGSDVPFFLCRTSAALARGRGERITPLRVPLGLHFAIAAPAEGLQTARVYARCRPAERPRSVAPLIEALRQSRVGRIAALMHNGLERPAEALSPAARSLNSRFSGEPVLGHLISGSGSACFGLCASRRHAARVAARLRAARLGRVFVASSRP